LVYVAVFVATAVWAVWEVGWRGWPLVPRLFGPTVLLLLALAVVPALTRQRGPRRAALGGLAALVLFGVLTGVMVSRNARNEAVAALPPPSLVMGDASLAQAGADWPAYGGSYSARRYSPLAQITPENVSRLRRVWVAHTRDLPSERAKNKYGAETTPLK